MEVEDPDDDMVVLIVGEGDAATEDGEPAIKVEKSALTNEEINSMIVEYLENSEKYDDNISMVKQEISDGDTDDPLWSLKGFDEEEHLEDFVIMDGDHKPKKNPANDGTKRTRMIKPSARCSYIQEMIKECPELRHDEEELVKRVADIMMTIKPPKPPSDFYKCDNDNGILSYICSLCNRKTINVMELARHWQDQHGQRYLKCLACGVDFRAVSSLHRHEKRCVAADAVVVLKARAIAVGNKGRDRPFLKPRTKKIKVKYRYKKTFNCSMCPATFTSRMPLDAHENLHRGERPYTCDFCLMPYASYTALSRHRQMHGDQVFICDHCERPFKTKHLIISHMLTHSEPRFVCNQCGHKYSTKLALNQHVWRVHLKLPPPAACPVCPKRYARNSNLKIHMKAAHGMELITRNMYIKSLPKLTELELEKAKVIMKSDVSEFSYEIPKNCVVLTDDKKNKRKPITKPPNINMDNHEIITGDITSNDDQKNDDENQIIVDITDTPLSTDVLEFVRQLQVDAVEENRNVKVLLMDNGSVVHIIESEDDVIKLNEMLEEKRSNVAVEKSMCREMSIDLMSNGEGHTSHILQVQYNTDS